MVEAQNISYQYIGFGSVDAMINVFISLVLAMNRNLLKKFAFIFGMAFGDTVSGLSLFINGLVRLIRINDDSVRNFVHPSECISLIQFYVFGNQLLAAMFVFVGIERAIAVGLFMWYHKKWNDKASWIGIFCVFLLSLGSVAVAYVIAFSQSTDTKITADCGVANTIGKIFAIYRVVICAVGGARAFLPTLAFFTVFFSAQNAHGKTRRIVLYSLQTKH